MMSYEGNHWKPTIDQAKWDRVVIQLHVGEQVRRIPVECILEQRVTGASLSKPSISKLLQYTRLIYCSGQDSMQHVDPKNLYVGLSYKDLKENKTVSVMTDDDLSQALSKASTFDHHDPFSHCTAKAKVERYEDTEVAGDLKLLFFTATVVFLPGAPRLQVKSSETTSYAMNSSNRKRSSPLEEKNINTTEMKRAKVQRSSSPQDRIADSAQSRLITLQAQETVMAQKRLLQLFHASQCDAGVNCRRKHCAEIKVVWDHLTKCQNRKCKTKHCVSSRMVLSHYRKCVSSTCDICPAVRQTIKLQRRQDKTRLFRASQRKASIRPCPKVDTNARGKNEQLSAENLCDACTQVRTICAQRSECSRESCPRNEGFTVCHSSSSQ